MPAKLHQNPFALNHSCFATLQSIQPVYWQRRPDAQNAPYDVLKILIINSLMMQLETWYNRKTEMQTWKKMDPIWKTDKKGKPFETKPKYRLEQNNQNMHLICRQGLGMLENESYLNHGKVLLVGVRLVLLNCGTA